MPHSFIRIWVHAVWGTKERRGYIKPAIEKQVHEYIKGQLQDIGSPVTIINGTEDHIHVLFLLNRQRSIGETIKQVKGSTSRWINEQKLTDKKFSWQVGYGAFGVDEDSFERVFHYIRTQKYHHKQQDFKEEFEELVRENGIDLKVPGS